MARTVVTNVLVLTAGTRYDRQDPNNANPQPTSVVTIAVLPEDGERIALATTQGQLSLALRNPTDGEPTKTPGVKLAMLMRGPGAQPVVELRESRPVAVRPKIIQQVVAPPPPPVVPAVYRVETIRAAKRQDEVIR
jgi:pilus assembly protein CpaB